MKWLLTPPFIKASVSIWYSTGNPGWSQRHSSQQVKYVTVQKTKSGDKSNKRIPEAITRKEEEQAGDDMSASIINAYQISFNEAHLCCPHDLTRYSLQALVCWF